MKRLESIVLVLVVVVMCRAECDIEGCEQCLDPQPDAGPVCSLCGSGYLLQQGTCQHCPRGCGVCTPGTTAEVLACTSCGAGFYLLGTECGECSTFCQTCKGPTETDCLTCVAGSDYNSDTKLCDPFSKTAFIWIFAGVGFVIAILTAVLIWNCIKKAQEDKLRPPPIDQFAGLNEENQIKTKKKKKVAANSKAKVAPKKAPVLERRASVNGTSLGFVGGSAQMQNSPDRDRLRSSEVSQPMQTQFKFASDSDSKVMGGHSSTTPTAVSDDPRHHGI